jgi:hypothetical protein
MSKLKNLKQKMSFKWEWCGHCELTRITCPHCGNNCCNGSSGNSDGTIGGENPAPAGAWTHHLRLNELKIILKIVVALI